MRRLLFSVVFLALTTAISAQAPYFQQQVNFMIDVKLDDVEHVLDGNVAMEYINNSPDVLNEIYLHLWANAFRDRNTAFNRQKVRDGSSKFYFAKEKDLGNYSGLEFTVDGVGATLTLQPDNPDIGLLTLPKALNPGEKIIIKSDFKLKIPASFSRLGHVGESYQMTQWYPKPAVYDRDGWHAMPYLDMGEYYSEFGNYEVNITLPENYVVGATGNLATISEHKFLDQKIAESNKALQDTLPQDFSFPASSMVMKTITFQAENVHDFAWFADKRFYVQKSQVTLKNNKVVDTYVYFTNQEGELWKKAIDYVDRSLKFYSEHVGEYPWPHATALQSALSAGGGMEYPMITVIGLSGDAKSLDAVITHEVGHNWFYGILGFNERDYPWLDEGINSYYDHRYFYKYYGKVDIDALPDFVMKNSDYSLLQLGYLFQARRRADQAPQTHSNDFVPVNYWIGAYEKPAVVFRYLEYYLGTEQFDVIMKSFYKEWEFKHPGPDDFIKHVEAGAGKKLDWFFDGFIYTNKQLDYALTGLDSQDGNLKLTAANKGDIPAPFPIDAVKNDEVVKTIWVEGFEGTQEIDFPAGDYDYLSIDEQKLGIDINRKNNTQKLSVAPGPISVGFLAGFENSKQHSVYVAPILGWNNYDKTMIGAVLYNKFIPAKKFEFALAPTFSLVTKKLRGVGEIKYNIYPKTDKLKKISIGVSGKSFASNYNWLFDFYTDYYKIAPELKLELGTKKANSTISHSVSYRPVFLGEESSTFEVKIDSTNGDREILYTGNEREMNLTHDLRYDISNSRGVNPWSASVNLRQSSYETFGKEHSYLRASLVWDGEYTYARNRSFDVRLFVGGFLQNSRDTTNSYYSVQGRASRGTHTFSEQGFSDELYDNVYFGRSEDNGIWSQQIYTNGAGFKNAFGSPFGNGRTNKLLLAANLTADLPQDLPLKLPLKPYLDLGMFQTVSKNQETEDFEYTSNLIWSFGLSLNWMEDRLAIYFPIASHKDLANLYPERGGYGARITYKVDLNRINPFRLMDEIGF